MVGPRQGHEEVSGLDLARVVADPTNVHLTTGKADEGQAADYVFEVQRALSHDPQMPRVPVATEAMVSCPGHKPPAVWPGGNVSGTSGGTPR